MSDLLEAALVYAGRGWPVIPLHGWSLQGCTCGRRDRCPSPAKHPHTTNGLKDASTDPKQIREWWSKWPDANVGLVTGVAFDVLDVDGPEGLASFERLTAENGSPLGGIVVETGSGGRHYLFEPQGAGNRAGMVPGLDWRGEGGYIVAPPSIHASGRNYRRLVNLGNGIPPAPDWLVELVRPRRQAQASAGGSEWTQPANTASYGQRALESELAALALAEEGTRNSSLNKAGFSLFQLVKAGVLDEFETRAALAKVASQIGLEDLEIERTLQSAWDSAEARDLPAKDRVPEGVGFLGPSQPTGSRRKLKVKPLAGMPAIRTDWLWDGRVPMGALTLVGGREGIGKSTLCYDIASDITRGTVRGFHNGEPRNVLIVATEDDWNRTIIPRLRAAKANLDRIFQVEVEMSDPEAGPLDVTFPKDVEAMAELVRANDVDMVLLDPLLSRLSIKLDSHKDSDVRQALEPVTRFAAQTGCAVLGLIHVNKSGSKDPLTSLMGSRAFVAVARAVLYVMIDPEDEGLRLLLQAKNNLGISNIPALRFSIDNTPAGEDSNTREQLYSGKLNWRGESSMSVDMAMELADVSSDERTKVKDASEWLIDYLEAHNGLDERKAILAAAKVAGIAESTLDRAKPKANVSTKRVGGFQGPAVWFLPGHEPPAVASKSPVPECEGSEGSRPSLSPSAPLPSPTTTSLTDNSPWRLREVDDESLI